jgi:hypothetical protein
MIGRLCIAASCITTLLLIVLVVSAFRVTTPFVGDVYQVPEIVVEHGTQVLSIPHSEVRWFESECVPSDAEGDTWVRVQAPNMNRGECIPQPRT